MDTLPFFRRTIHDAGLDDAVVGVVGYSVPIEHVHPLQGGLLRRKYRRDRRPGMPIEPIWSFYPKFAWDVVSKTARSLRLLLWMDRVRRRVQKDPNRYFYTDQAMAPVADDEEVVMGPARGSVSTPPHR